MHMKNQFIISIKLTIVTMVIFGAGYPLLITGLAKVMAPNGGSGEVVTVNGKPAGFELIGQKFDDEGYFNTRPSAVDYNAAATGGSNKGPTNPEYLAQVQSRIDSFLNHNPDITLSQIPVDLITASGSGLDPHISAEAARIQIPRIAKARGIDAGKLTQLVEDHVDKPLLGIGPSRVHVLRLNIALDQLK
jgi:K+-transporting ATPase ATPase C chain